jgi:putative membrane protein
MDFKQLLKSWAIIAFGVLIASNTGSGIHYESREALIIAVILLSALNVFLKPVLMLFSLPFIILTFGIGIWIINALLFLFVGMLVSGFHIDTFGSALWGALVVSITSGVASLLFPGSKQNRFNVNVRRSGTPPRQESSPRQPKRVVENDDDVIDI